MIRKSYKCLPFEKFKGKTNLYEGSDKIILPDELLKIINEMSSVDFSETLIFKLKNVKSNNPNRIQYCGVLEFNASKVIFAPSVISFLIKIVDDKKSANIDRRRNSGDRNDEEH